MRVLKKIKGILRQDPEADAVSFWKLSSYDSRIQDYSHWCGSSRWNTERWSEYGRRNVGFALGTILEASGPAFIEQARTGSALEWGCGGGANVIALYEYFREVSGVEIAGPTLEECRRQAMRHGKKNFQGCLIDSGRPESALEKIGRGSLDFVLSIEVFQHFPSKDYTARVLQVISELLKDGALAWIQVRDDDGSPKLRQKHADYAANMIYMTSFTAEAFSRMGEKCGFTLVWNGRDASAGGDDHAYYLMRKGFPLTKGSP